MDSRISKRKSGTSAVTATKNRFQLLRSPISSLQNPTQVGRGRKAARQGRGPQDTPSSNNSDAEMEQPSNFADRLDKLFERFDAFEDGPFWKAERLYFNRDGGSSRMWASPLLLPTTRHVPVPNRPHFLIRRALCLQVALVAPTGMRLLPSLPAVTRGAPAMPAAMPFLHCQLSHGT